MTDRTVSVVLQARVTDYMTKISAAGKATEDLGHKVEVAKGRAAQGYHTIGVAGVAMGTVVAGGFALAIKASADFESKMALVRTLSHATGAQMTQLSGAALHVGQAYGYTANQVADAEAELVKAGVSVSDMMGGALVGALTLASAGQTDVATATTIAATAMTQFALKGKDVPHIADLLAAGADKALGSVVDLGYALDQAGPTAHQFGVSLEETVGTLAAFAQSGQIGERGGTIFQQMLLKLTAPSNQANDILKKLGISIYSTNGQFVGMANLAGQLHDKLGNLTLAERNHDLAVIFGARAIRGANILYQEGAQGIEDWTGKVNDSGFAALQASGKLDSLSGDVTKLKAALQTAFIGVGEGSQGPLRGMVQDLTGAVNAWNELPGPVKTSAEVLTAVAGAAAFAGGAALLLIPKIAATRLALDEMGISGGRVAAVLGKGGLFVGAVAAATIAVGAIDSAMHHTSINADAMTASLQNLALTGAVNGEITRAFGADLSDLHDVISLSGQGVSVFGFKFHNLGQTLTHSGGDFSDARNKISSVDQALADLVTSGHADNAKAAWDRISAAAKRQGVSVSQLVSRFPEYSGALRASADSATVAGKGVDKYGNAVGVAAKKTKTATDAAKHYSDALHALADPLFAMNQALQGVTDAQDAARKAVHKYGEDSAQARQANLDLASAALDAEAAARTLAASVKDGSVSIGDARKYLKAWVADGLLTKQQADDVSGSFDHLIGRAQTISGLHPHLQVTADTSQADAALSQLFDHIGQVVNAALSLGGSSNINSNGGVGSAQYGPPVPGGKTKSGSNQSSGGASTTTTPTTSDSGYYVPGGGGSGGGGGSSGGGGGGKSKADRPPTVQEIVHAILTGTIPPSIDKLSHVLQTEIRHLTTTVGNAQQYRSTVRSNLLGYASLSNATAPTDVYGRQMGAVKVNSYLKGRLANLKQFVHLRHRLEHDGAGQGLLQEFEEIGPDANPMMRQLLAGGSKAVRHANRLEHRIHHLSGTAASEAATDRYGAQIVHQLSRMPREEARELVKALRHEHINVSLKEVARERGRNVRAKSG